MLKFNLKVRYKCIEGDKFEYYYEEWVKILLYSRDNLLNFADWQITYCSTELFLHRYNTITYELVHRHDYL